MTTGTDLADLHCEHSIVIAAAADDLYDYIADMPRVGEISPQCIGGVWESDARAVGARFIGSNQAGERSWSARMRVCVADRPREFAWENIGDGTKPAPERVVPFARWGYTFTPVEGGTRVEESWRLLNMYPELEARGIEMIRAIPERMRASMEATLLALRTRFEASPS